ncbi:hypothetical protein SKAU_G00013430 [Synaphobranchus kaupii]|uniref:Uncharacterized protein n=1 Tax=Synaphobranchus kaupii TaxID=118154 RepID=A0A9Q1JD70_SYNKA|nr:hypothetical protein SKAU_G00013430 [Synaphobranchus kaupii]
MMRFHHPRQSGLPAAASQGPAGDQETSLVLFLPLHNAETFCAWDFERAPVVRLALGRLPDAPAAWRRRPDRGKLSAEHRGADLSAAASIKERTWRGRAPPPSLERAHPDAGAGGIRAVCALP